MQVWQPLQTSGIIYKSGKIYTSGIIYKSGKIYTSGIIYKSGKIYTSSIIYKSGKIHTSGIIYKSFYKFWEYLTSLQPLLTYLPCFSKRLLLI